MDNNAVPSEISISVTDPVLREAIKNYVVYSVKGLDKKGTFQMERRYSDFEALRKALVQRWPGCFIPPLPPK